MESGAASVEPPVPMRVRSLITAASRHAGDTTISPSGWMRRPREHTPTIFFIIKENIEKIKKYYYIRVGQIGQLYAKVFRQKREKPTVIFLKKYNPIGRKNGYILPVFCTTDAKSRPWHIATGGKGIYFTPNYLWVDSVTA